MKKEIGLTLLAGALLAGCSEKTAEVRPDTRPLVRTGVATNGVAFADALRVQGVVRAKTTVSVSARIPGTIDEILVEDGSKVKKGEILFRVDQVNLDNAVRAAKDDREMALAKRAQAVAAEAKAALDLKRMSNLLSDRAVTKDAFERAEVAAKSASAALDAAKAMVMKAETGLAVAEKNRADSEVKAPFDAIVTKKLKNAGDFVGAGMKVFELEDDSVYEVCLSLNAAQYGRVRVGETEIGADGFARPFKVTYKAPSVNALTRTFEVRAVIDKTPEIAAGMVVGCSVVFARRTSQAVPASAVALRGGSDAVFKVVGGRAVRVPVKAGLSSAGWREILAPTLSPEDRLIVEGMLLVNEGEEVRVVHGAL